jgi:hypothetical protein
VDLEVTNRMLSGNQTLTIADQSGNVIAQLNMPPTYGGAQAAYVTAILNGSQRARLLLDTGASRTVLYLPAGSLNNVSASQNYALLADGRRVPVQEMTLASIQIGGHLVSNFPITVMEHVDYANRDSDGVIGTDFLFRGAFTLDPVNRRLVFLED